MCKECQQGKGAIYKSNDAIQDSVRKLQSTFCGNEQMDEFDF